MKDKNALRFMERCFELALRGRGLVNPNPMVGCVIVKDRAIVGEGYHRKFGGPHAEILALADAGGSARNATLYVNLEPCAHHGKTPPCVDAIVAAGIRNIVASTKDPNPLVAGSGLRKLRTSGVNVTVGLLRPEAERLNEKFFRFMRTGLPYVGVKVAQTVDGRIADISGRSKWITSLKARAHVHALRSEYDAVLVGAATVMKDDPELTVRDTRGKNPLRVVLDGRFVVSPGWRIFDVRKAPTIVLTSGRALKRLERKAVLFERSGVQVFGLDSGTQIQPEAILRVLADLGISSLLVEGGSKTIQSFLERRRVQKVHCFIAGKILGSGLSAFSLNPRPLSRSLSMIDLRSQMIGEDILIEGSLAES